MQARTSLVTRQRASAIFEALCDLPAAPRWLPNCLALEVLDGGPVAVGSRLRYTYRELGYTGSLACSIAGLVPDRHVAIAFHHPRVDASFEFLLDDRPDATTIEHGVSVVAKARVIRAFMPLVRRALPGRMARALRGLERLAVQRVGSASDERD